jgi:hypothetical protein
MATPQGQAAVQQAVRQFAQTPAFERMVTDALSKVISTPTAMQQLQSAVRQVLMQLASGGGGGGGPSGSAGASGGGSSGGGGGSSGGGGGGGGVG